MIRRFFVLLRAKESDSEVISDAPDNKGALTMIVFPL
jgi:hypothetical protein